MPDANPTGCTSYAKDIDHVVVSRDQINARVCELAEDIAGSYPDIDNGSAEEVTIVAVMTGSLVFLADLIRRLPLRLRIEIASASSYPGASASAGKLEIGVLPSEDLAGRHVLLVDDILDTGGTLTAIADRIAAQGPQSLKTCVLLAKDRPDISNRPQVDFVGFHVDKDFVVGYGLDYDGLYRNLADICVLKGDVLAAAQASRTGVQHR